MNKEKKRPSQKSRGFTLLEVMIAVIIISILIVVITQGMPFIKGRVRDNSRLGDLDSLRRSIELYKIDNGVYPATPSGMTFLIFDTENDAYTALLNPVQMGPNYIPGIVPNYFAVLPQDPLPGLSNVPGCEALGYNRSLIYFSNGDHYKLIYHCASETNNYPDDSMYFDPARPTWAWAASDDINYTSFTLGW